MQLSVTLTRTGLGQFKVIDAKKLLKQFAVIVERDILEHLENGQQIDDAGALAPLAQSTIARKREPHEIDFPGRFAKSAGRLPPTGKGKKQKVGKPLYISQFPTKPLIDGGNLMDNFLGGRTIKEIENGYEMRIGVQRHEIAKKLQIARPFFGISPTAKAEFESKIVGKPFIVK